ncbi:MAG TPA: hypothetical protein VI094_22145 [Propionibacteriaceae bacterium]
MMHPDVEDQLRSHAFAIVAAYLRNDLDGVLALVGDDDAELLPIVVEILTGALLQLVGPDELERQVTAWLGERAARLAG